MTDTILVVNAGSSSIKFELFGADDPQSLTSLLGGQLDGIGTRPRLAAKDATNKRVIDENYQPADIATLPDGIRLLGNWLRSYLHALPSAIGHRVVHGGPDYAAPVILDDDIIEDLHRFVPLAPLHQPNNLAPIKAVRDHYPDLPQVACFDTAFHRGHDDIIDRFAVPEPLYREGVRRYGFHGLSYEYLAEVLPKEAPEIARGKVIGAHLGNGASLCAMVDGRSIDSTMGFTALDGLPMGTRPGALDPGVVLYMIEEKKMSASAISHVLYRECGLKGLSGFTSDVRDLLASEEESARRAMDYYAYRIAQEVGSMGASMEGIDGLVFTAGVGENAPSVRADVLRRCKWLGFELDDEANQAGGPLLTKSSSKVRAYVIPTDEERMIAIHALRLIRSAG